MVIDGVLIGDEIPKTHSLMSASPFKYVVLVAVVFGFPLSVVHRDSGVDVVAQTKRKPVRSLSAEEIAELYLPSIALIECETKDGEFVQGSGFLVARDLLITNYHVVEGMRTATVILSPLSGRRKTTYQDVKLLRFNPGFDLALLGIGENAEIDANPGPLLVGVDEMASLARQVRAQTTPTETRPTDPLGIKRFLTSRHIPCLAPDESLRIGETIYALGNPEGLTGSFTAGIVSGLRRRGSVRYIQITAPVSAGSSGGPIINSKGMVVGVVVASFTEGQNLNLAVRSEHVREMVGPNANCVVATRR